METINDITQDFGTLYHPKSALVFYETKGSNTDVYVEHFDMDKNGNPINAHPLTVKKQMYWQRHSIPNRKITKPFEIERNFANQHFAHQPQCG